MSKKQVIAALAIVGVVAAIAVVALSYESPSSVNLHKKASTRFTEEEREFINFIAKHRKNYFNREEYDYRLSKFADNYRKIQSHNSKNGKYSLAINHFADLDSAEFKRLYTGTFQRRRPGALTAPITPKAQLPTSIDWTTKGAVTPVKNQGQCGSCWAFSTTGSLEGAYFLSTGKLVSLSEQQLVDCSGSYGNMGCNGGLMDNAFKYVEANGLCSESSYGYEGVQGTCQASKCTPVVTKGEVKKYYDVQSGSMDGMMSAVAGRPVSIAIEADQSAFQFYSGGVIDSGCGQSLDHGVLAVGYMSHSGEDAWKVKNSWGPSWGDNGFVYIARNSKDECGVMMQASYPSM